MKASTYFTTAFTISGVSAMCQPTTFYEFILGLLLLSLTYLYWDLNRDFEKLKQVAENVIEAIENAQKQGKP